MSGAYKMLNMTSKLLWLLEHLPDVGRNSFEGFCESLWLILLVHVWAICDFADVDSVNPAGELLIDLCVRFWVLLSRVTNADELAFRKPVVDLDHTAHFVCLDALS